MSAVMNIGFQKKKRWISWPCERLLASNERLCPMKLARGNDAWFVLPFLKRNEETMKEMPSVSFHLTKEEVGYIQKEGSLISSTSIRVTAPEIHGFMT
jgi:hypothetical protein